jgi:hypothetical protein
MLPKGWGENELGIRLVFDEPWRRESLDRLIVAIYSTLAASTSVALRLATSATPVCSRLAACSFCTEALGCVQYWPVPRASAKITIECLLDIMFGGIGVVSKQSVEALSTC